MGDVFGGMSGPQLTAFAAVVGGIAGGVVVAVAAIVAPGLSRARQVEALAKLKSDLAAAGLSAGEIVRVVEAGPAEGALTAGRRGCSH